jgi:hypothetical protein
LTAQFPHQRSVGGRESRLRCRVGDHARQRCLGNDCADVHEEALCCRKCRDDPFDQPEWSEDVGEEQLLQHDVVCLAQRAESDDTGGVDHSVEATERIVRRSHERSAGIDVAQVELDEGRTGHAHRFEAVPLTPGEQEAGTATCELTSNRRAETAAGTDNGDDCAVETCGH